MRINSSNNPCFVVKTVAAAGTPEQVSASEYRIPNGEEVCFRAHPDNTGYIYLADTSDNALSSSSAHTRLSADQAETLVVNDLRKVYVNSSVSGEKVVVSFARN
jgi:hypothetical protein